MDNDQLIKAYYSFKNSPEGQTVLDDLENKFYKSSLVPDNFNENHIMLNVGAREVVVYILSKIEEFELKQRGKG